MYPLMSPRPKIEPYGGFSIVRIVLSDALPPEAFHPDFPDFDPDDPDRISRLKDKSWKNPSPSC